MRFRTAWVAVVLPLFIALQSCAPYRKVEGPLVQVSEQQFCGQRAGSLIVLLPGLYDRPADFLDQGFVQAVRERRLDADIILLDAHVGYYNERQIVDRLQSEVIGPAHAQGYGRIWLVGISLGGLGTLLYAQAHPQDLTGFFAMAPFLGENAIVKDVTTQGLAQWQPADPEPLGTPAWRLGQAYLKGAPGLPQGHIGHGEDDRFARANALLASALPPEHRYVAPGGHDWGAWKNLWAQFLNSGVIAKTERPQRACATALAP
jgi:pimeloyl-ACP methyl ester carboxylesterase